jgi:hypothetical protein
MTEYLRRKETALLFCILMILNLYLLIPGLPAKDTKLQVEEIISQHLASIGTPEARAAIKSRVVTGAVQMISHLGSGGQLAGKIGLFSEGRKLRYETQFGAVNYAGDQFAFDGDKALIGQVRPGERTILSQFIFDNSIMIKEGLLGGTLSSAWPILDLKAREAKLNYTGLKTIEGKHLHEVQYRPKKGGGDVQIHLYFDPDNFRHVRTRYRLVKPMTVAADIKDSSASQETVYTIVEQFDNFKGIEGLNLPQTYTLKYTMESESRTIMLDWNAVFSQIVQNQQMDPQYFGGQ